MKWIAAIVMAGALSAQTPAPTGAAAAVMSTKDVEALSTRIIQLMESTALATPGLVKAAEPVQQNAQKTYAEMRKTPQNPGLIYQFLTEAQAYLAVSAAFPRNYPFPEVADKQYGEIREGIQRLQRHFQAILDAQTQVAAAREADRHNLKRYKEANSKLPPPGKAPRVVFMGDSITDFWRLNEYFGARDFINRGISGQVTEQMLMRFKQDVLDLRPKVVVLLAGTNDISRGVPVKVIEDNISMMADMATANKIEVVLASILPVSDYHKDVKASYEMTKTRPLETINEINRWIKGYCDRKHYIYLDYFAAMVDSAGQLKAELADDGLHPNATGYRIMSPLAQESVGRAIAAANAAAEEAASGAAPRRKSSN